MSYNTCFNDWQVPKAWEDLLGGLDTMAVYLIELHAGLSANVNITGSTA